MFLCLLLFTLTELAQGGLVFTKKKHQQKVGWDHDVVRIEFPFENRGKHPVKITQLSASCGCTKVDQKVLRVFQPGEKSSVNAVYEVGKRTGSQIEVLYIETDEPGKKIYSLQLVLALPKVAEMVPGMLSWRENEAAKTKVMNIRWMGAASAELDSDISIPAGWDLHFVEIQKDRKWQLHVTPESTGKPVMLQIPLIFQSEQKERSTEAILLIQD